MEVNPKSHASKKRGKKFASRRDFKYGGKVGGHSVKRAQNWGWRDPYSYLAEDQVEVTSLSDQDRLLKNADVRLPVEKELGFRLEDANKRNFSKMQKVKEALENSGATSKVSDLEVDELSSWSSRATVKRTWYALAASKEDVNGIVAHEQQKKQRQTRKMLAEFGIKVQQGRVIDRRVKLTRFLPHGEILNRKVPCMWGKEATSGAQKKMGRLDITFRTPMKVVGIGFRALKVRHINWTYDDEKYVTVGPLRAKVQFQKFNSNVPAGEWTGTQAKSDGVHTRVHYSGPKDGSREVAHNLNISNCKALKIEAMDLIAYDGSVAHIRCNPYDPNFDSRNYRGHYCFEIFVYGSPEPKAEEESEEEVPVGSGCIRNCDEVQDKVTVVCFSEPDTVDPKWSFQDGDPKYSYYNKKEFMKSRIRTDEDFVIRGHEQQEA